MLVLSRKRNEAIVINDNIVITVADIRGDKVRLGIEAPQDYPVYRQEVKAAFQQHAARAASSSPPDSVNHG
jgi:carbon storage regulator